MSKVINYNGNVVNDPIGDIRRHGRAISTTLGLQSELAKVTRPQAYSQYRKVLYIDNDWMYCMLKCSMKNIR